MPADFINRIHQGDCVAGLNALPEGVVDLAFADPPFNIGYKYDVYDDRREHEHYLDWSRQWISAVYRALKPNGTFWLAIGDEYAAELKLMSQEIGFHTRSWVVWYYTFGVNCVNKFTRSHAHLFYFVKSKDSFTFRGDAPENRIPSARQLVYNDARANPKGRLPDDTWILRPQDMADCFQAEEDTWYFPRVAGTFKERAGFHGCQMPEQLLGRIIRSCSNEGDLVLDPFSGSATTLVTAKKLGREFLGFELSPDYAERGAKRVEEAVVGAPLVGSADPTRSAPRTPGVAHAEAAAAAEEVVASTPSDAATAFNDRAESTAAVNNERDTSQPANTAEPVAGESAESNEVVVVEIAEVAMTEIAETEIAVTEIAVDEIAAAEIAATQVVATELEPQEPEPIASESTTTEANNSEASACAACVDDTKPDIAPVGEVDEAPAGAHDPQRDLIEAFRRACGGYSADRVMADPKLQGAFLEHCRALNVPGEPRTWNASLFRLRKAGKLKAVPTTMATELAWTDCEPYAFAAEIALAKTTATHPDITLDELLCDPTPAAEFDKWALKFGGGKKGFEYRWTALKLRKEAKQLRVRAEELKRVEPVFGTPMRLSSRNWNRALPDAPGLYLLLNAEGDRVYIGATVSLRTRIMKQAAATRLKLYDRSGDVRVSIWPIDRPYTDLLALQQRLIHASHPPLNASFLDGHEPRPATVAKPMRKRSRSRGPAYSAS